MINNNKIDTNNPKISYFSVPMPFDTKIIDQIASINENFKKCKIGTLYNNMPAPFNKRYNEWVMVNRGVNENIRSYYDFAKYAEYAQNKGFEVCYLLNSPKAFSHNDFLTFQNEFHSMLYMLNRTNINLVKFSNVQVANLLREFAPDIRLSSSTATEYSSISHYKYLLTEYPNIESINVAISQNHNFALLKSLRHEFPNVNIEIMVNEPCLKYCPARISHISSFLDCHFDCHKIKHQEELLFLCKSNIIYPWWINEYMKLGINHFKIYSFDDGGTRGNIRSIKPIYNYLYCVENGIGKFSAHDLFNHILYMYTSISIPEHILASDIIDLLPDIKYFIKNGHKCSSYCGVNCRYCYNCAEKLKEYILENGGKKLPL